MQTCCIRGDLNGAEEHFAAGLPFFRDPDLKQQPGTAQTAIFGVAAWNAWMLGRIDLARARMTEMLQMVNISNPFEEAVSCTFSAHLQIFLQEYEAVETTAVRALELSERHQFHVSGGIARFFLGHARAQLGRADEGSALIRQGLSELVPTGVHVMRGELFLAGAQERDGKISDALVSLEQALAASQERIWRPEILRLRGELRLKQGQAEFAEADLREALTLARSMNAKSWELRATMSLARLLASQGRREEAHDMLAEIYYWFTEGFDTADLKDAKALLDELSE
jgi:predicted ATPase